MKTILTTAIFLVGSIFTIRNTITQRIQIDASAIRATKLVITTSVFWKINGDLERLKNETKHGLKQLLNPSFIMYI